MFATAWAVFSVASAIPYSDAQPAQRRQLSPAARALTKEPYEPAYSPIVLAGTVRLIEAALVVAVGFTVYAPYVVPGHGFAWYYFVAILCIPVLPMPPSHMAAISQVHASPAHSQP